MSHWRKRCRSPGVAIDRCNPRGRWARRVLLVVPSSGVVVRVFARSWRFADWIQSALVSAPPPKRRVLGDHRAQRRLVGWGCHRHHRHRPRGRQGRCICTRRFRVRPRRWAIGAEGRVRVEGTMSTRLSRSPSSAARCSSASVSARASSSATRDRAVHESSNVASSAETGRCAAMTTRVVRAVSTGASRRTAKRARQLDAAVPTASPRG